MHRQTDRRLQAFAVTLIHLQTRIRECLHAPTCVCMRIQVSTGVSFLIPACILLSITISTRSFKPICPKSETKPIVTNINSPKFYLLC